MEMYAKGYMPRSGVTAGIPFEAAKLLEDVKLMMERDPQGAHAAALHLVSLLTRPENSGSTVPRGGLAPWQMRMVDRYLRANLDRSVRVEDLARQVSLSASHFSRAFKTSFGTTPHMYLIRLRLERAQTLMLTTPDPLSQIALICGLADQTHLSKLFRREIGETPGAWRRRNLWHDLAKPPHRERPALRHHPEMVDRPGAEGRQQREAHPPEDARRAETISM